MKKVSPKIQETKKESSRFDRLIVIFFGVLAFFFAEAFLYWTAVPFFQMRTYLDDLTHGRIRKIVKTDFIFSPYSYAQRQPIVSWPWVRTNKSDGYFCGAQRKHPEPTGQHRPIEPGCKQTT